MSPNEYAMDDTVNKGAGLLSPRTGICLHVEILGLPLLHVEYGPQTPEQEPPIDLQHPITIGFQPPQHPDEIPLRPEMRRT